MVRWRRLLPRTDWRSTIPASMAVLVIAVLTWYLVAGVTSGEYRHFAAQGDPSLQTIPVPGPDPADPDGPRASVSQLGHYGFFWSERAFHYRTTLAFATGHPAAASLAHDTFQQHPDGVDQWRQYTLLMEPVYGFLYRLAGDPSRPVVEFLLGLVPLIHVLALLPLYAVARRLGVRRPAAVAAVLVAATCGLGFTRLAGSLLLKETFSLLLLWIFMALHMAAWRTGRTWQRVAAAAVLVPLLASWHLAQFLVAVVLGATALARAVSGPVATDRRDWLLPAGYLIAALVAGMTPSLAARRFLLDAPFALVAAWFLAELLVSRWPVGRARTRLGILAGTTLLLVGPTLVWPGHGGAYGHVGGLLLAKLSHGFRLPDDPELLPFAVRLFWTRPFHTPPPAEIWAGAGAHTVLFLGALLWGLVAVCRRETPPWRRAVLMMTLIFVLAWLAVARLGVVFVPFGALAVVLAADTLAQRRSAWWPAAVLAAAAVFNLGTVLAESLSIAADVRAGRSARLHTAEDTTLPLRVELLRWVTRNTPGPGSIIRGEPAAILADIALSPQLLLYTGRPTLLNSQFENRPAQDRYERFLTALYAREPSLLHAFARQYGADYLILPRRAATADGPRSLAWMAAAELPLHREQMAVRLHFTPERVPGFRPVWDNETYRVFRVLPTAEPAGSVVWEPGFGPGWDPRNFTFSDGFLSDLAGDREGLADFDRRVDELQELQARILGNQARRRQGRPDLMALQRRLGLLRFARLCGEPADAVAEGQLANLAQTILAGVDPVTGRSVERALAELLDGGTRGPGWHELLATIGGTPQHQAVAAQLAAVSGRYDEAAAIFGAAAARWGDPCGAQGDAPAIRRRLWDETLLWLAAAGQDDTARRLAATWRPCVGESGGPGHLVRQLAAIRPSPR